MVLIANPGLVALAVVVSLAWIFRMGSDRHLGRLLWFAGGAFLVAVVWGFVTLGTGNELDQAERAATMQCAECDELRADVRHAATAMWSALALAGLAVWTAALIEASERRSLLKPR